ncbi:prolyl oligopeptidase family serine peptidase [soil metagenome]
MTAERLSFPRHYARTQRFTLGVPRAFTIAPEGDRLAFLRTRSGTDPVSLLWTLDVATGEERCVVDPATLLAGSTEELSQRERARRERAREAGGGVVGYAADRELEVAAFALSGGAYVSDLRGGGARALPTATPVVDPRPDPTGRHVAYVAGGALRVIGVDGSGDRALAEPDGESVTWGLAEFVAAEEMSRYRGFWWSPDGERLLAARVDESPVQRWHVADPANPDAAPVVLAYPAAGTPNADVELHVVTVEGRRTQVRWDREQLPYLATADWSERGVLISVQSRDQRRWQALEVDPESGDTRLLAEETDEAWVEIAPGVPAWTKAGILVTVADREGDRRLLFDGEPITPTGMQVRGVADVDGDTVVFTASNEPTEVHLYEVGADRTLHRVSDQPGVHAGRRRGGLTVQASQSLEWFGTRVQVLRDGAQVATIDSRADEPTLTLSATLLRAGDRELRTALLLPGDHVPGSRKLPVLLDPYGGPHAQRVLAVRSAFLSSQWFADQGFAVVVVDGRGTPGRGAAWERAIHLGVAEPVLDDQISALHAVAERYPDDLDLSRVGIRGWSFGGYLAALAVLRRPDIFHAAVAGAPVTDWALYDTHYTERYLGMPAEQPDAYAATSLLTDAERLERPLMLIHGLADDNVVAAHTLRLSSALLAAGRPHTVLPLSGVTHMTPQEVVAENLLKLQVEFLHQALADPAPRRPTAA